MKCKYCEDSGIAHYENGPDDYNEDYCYCEAGEEKREQKMEAWVDDYIQQQRENDK
jgi:hypothetical protein